MKNSVADPFPCPEKDGSLSVRFSASSRATPHNESCGVFVQLCGIALNVIDSTKFARNERAAVL